MYAWQGVAAPFSWSDCRYNKHISYALIWSINRKTLQNISLSPNNTVSSFSNTTFQSSKQHFTFLPTPYFLHLLLTASYKSVKMQFAPLLPHPHCVNQGETALFYSWGQHQSVFPHGLCSSLSLGRLLSAQSMSSGSVLPQSQLNATRCHCVPKIFGNMIRVCPVINI